MNKKIKSNTYIFDFDGVLVDSMPTWAGVYIKLLEENNITYPNDIVKIITPLGNDGAAKYCISLGLDMTIEEIDDHNHKIYKKRYFEEIPAKNNVLRVLTELKKRGVSLNVLTASHHLYVDPCLKRVGLYNLFDNIWSIDDFGYKKNEVIIYEKAAERLGKSTQECTFFDDNFIAAKTAKESGMISIGVYDMSSEEMKEQIKEVTDRYINDFEELLMK